MKKVKSFFSGRLTRRQFLLRVMIGLIIELTLRKVIGSGSSITPQIMFMGDIYLALLAIPRMADIGWSRWFVLVLIVGEQIPILHLLSALTFWIILGCFPSKTKVIEGVVIDNSLPLKPNP